MSIIKNCSDENFENIVKNSNSLREIAYALGYKAFSGSLSKIIKNRITTLNIKTDHFSQLSKKQPLNKNDIFCKNSVVSQRTLRKYFLANTTKPYKCDICGISSWNGKELTLILDHINGRNNDNRIKNLRLVCPNCNSQLETFAGRNNKGKIKTHKNFCIDCSCEISRGATRCIKCNAKNYRTQPPISKQELTKLSNSYPNTHIAKMLNVSDKTIAHWKQKYNIK